MFVENLRELGLDVLELEAEERYSECVAVDDTAIVINGTALMCNPAGLHRQGEVSSAGQPDTPPPTPFEASSFERLPFELHPIC